MLSDLLRPSSAGEAMYPNNFAKQRADVGDHHSAEKSEIQARTVPWA